MIVTVPLLLLLLLFAAGAPVAVCVELAGGVELPPQAARRATPPARTGAAHHRLRIATSPFECRL